MSSAIISVEGLGKRYRIRHNAERQRYTALRDVIAQKLKAPFQFLRRGKKEEGGSGSAHSPLSSLHSPRTSTSEDFWALRDVSFEVRQGDVVGIIGRNGAGKSTLLKILSRITEPTEGRVLLKGRVASLLEVGTGFHPELTGRENIFLNGAILGMSRAEIRKKFDEIVAFAEVEKFLDTPVKRYSSGMYVRLAFAVAADLEPEILIVDEVLAVGDAQFQKKCLGKMKNVATKEGRTVIFVSHNMSAIATLCSCAMTMGNGKILNYGSVNSCVETYLSGGDASGSKWERESKGNNKSPAQFTKIFLEIEGSQPSLNLHLTCQKESVRKHKPAFLAVDILDDTGTGIMQAIPTLECLIDDSLQSNNFKVSIQLPPMVPGHYAVTLWIGPHNTETYDMIKSIVSFEISDSPTKGRSFPHSRNHGFIVPPSKLWIQSQA
jgi:lipopolysaccharide transport system ATP-binding protein